MTSPEVTEANPQNVWVAAEAKTAWAAPVIKRRPVLPVPRTVVSPSELGEHIEIMRLMSRINVERNTPSHTTERFRTDLLYFLLDNPSRGPIVEVGIMHGGFSSLFAYVAAVTGREFYAVDVAPHFIEQARLTCAHFGFEKYANFHLGDVASFIKAKVIERPDLMFIDSGHMYSGTVAELGVVHAMSNPPRCIVLYDFNYRHGHQAAKFNEPLHISDPVAIDFAFFDFYTNSSVVPFVKRVGGYSGDGTVGTRANPGSHDDFIEDYGTEGVMLLYL